ncbi:hypothetical protein B0H11DRAFT_2068371 [Mycena galericulata]|nr:hypothetical protein B0H11DRAFT_2073951 [Mycena galericulata]KAJ7454958.1 hypothetical protein B0H11DRAFT_2068371 [Mycena galericulata]
MPISGNVTAFVGRLPQRNSGDLFILWNYLYRKLIVIEAVDLRETSSDTEYYQNSLTNHWVGKIQALLNTVDFEHEDVWAYFIDKPSPRIIQKSRNHYRIPCDSLWAPRVDISEIDTNFIWCYSQGLGRGVWRGKKVDIHIGCDDGGLRLVERETRGLKAVEGMDLTYDLVAHVFRGDLLIGILTESCQASRTIRASDRATVFAAFARLERAFMLHDFLIDDQRILINEYGRVRILDLNSIVFYGRHERKKLEEDAQKYHWDRLHQIFENLGPYRSAVYPSRFVYSATTILARTPSPERVLLLTIALDYIARTQVPDNEKKRHRKPSSKTRETAKVIIAGPVSLGHKAHKLALTKMAHGSGYTPPPPPYSKLPLPYERPAFRRVLLAPPEDTIDGGGFIVEVA